MPSIRLALLALAATATLAACGNAREVSDDRRAGTDCASCHGFPPPPGANGSAATTHPQNDSCWVCHSSSVAEGNVLVAGGTHMNGTVEATGGHPEGFANPAVHGPEANAGIASCQDCHGADYAGGTSGTSCNACHGTNNFADWQTNCTFCHGTKTPAWTTAQLVLAAPPEGVNGETAATDRAVGAHQKHLAGVSTLSAGFDCAECHPSVTDLGHTGPAPADVAFGARATTGGAAPAYAPGPSPTCSSTYCHGSFEGGVGSAAATWTNVTPMTCASCHPAAPTTGRHPASSFTTHRAVACASCHPGFTNATVDPAQHVNGVKNAIVRFAGFTGWDCSRCHDTF